MTDSIYQELRKQMDEPFDLISTLIIDDEKDLRDGCERILSRMNCKIFKATNGEEGLDFIKKTPVSLVLLDLKMPGMDGLEVLKHIHKFDKHILVIIITGYATIETAIKAMKQGAYDFISKPFSPAQLRITVERAIEKFNLTKEAEELKLARQKTLIDLGRTKSRVRTIIETLANGVLVTDTNGDIVLINPAAKKNLGFTDDIQMGDGIEKHISDDGLREFITNISKDNFNKEDEIPSYEFTGSDKKDILAQGKPVLSDDGEYIGAVINFMDITPMKILDRLKSEFVAKVSHELRSPLATIHEQLNFVLKEKRSGTDKSGRHIISRAKEKTMGLISFIGDLLDLSKIEAGNEHSKILLMRLDKTLMNIVDFLSVRADTKKQKLTVIKPKDTIQVIAADPVAIDSIFGNLITNAIIYTPEEGTIDIEINNSGKNVVVTVRDTGYGIEKKYLDKIFERFYRVKNSNTRFITGTGLGLPIVKSLIDSINGKITVESTVNKGTTFTVIIPAN